MIDNDAGSAARPLSVEQKRAISTIAAQPPGVGRTAAFLRCVLGERSYFDIAMMLRMLADDPPLTEGEMRYIAERWQADAD